jgi:hypothetical protein
VAHLEISKALMVFRFIWHAQSKMVGFKE